VFQQKIWIGIKIWQPEDKLEKLPNLKNKKKLKKNEQNSEDRGAITTIQHT
jgi:hypothetical protein